MEDDAWRQGFNVGSTEIHGNKLLGPYLSVWEVHFHPSNPDHLFTCSEDGSLWHWDASTDVPEKSSLFHQGKEF